MQPAWYWADDHGFVDQDDGARAVVRYSLPDLDDRFFEPAWCYYPDWAVLAATDTYRTVLGTAPDSAGKDAGMWRWRPDRGGRSRT